MGTNDTHESEPDSDPLDFNISLFTEPSGYYPPPPNPTTETHALLSGQVLTLHLVGHSPLWGHHLWHAGRLISTYLEQHPSLVLNKTVLELGAGAGLPSLVCGILGAKKVVVTDYPEPDLVSNLRLNIHQCHLLDSKLEDEEGDGLEKTVVAEGYCWGADPSPLLAHLVSPALSPSPLGFDVLILADLLFNHSEHRKLLLTIQKTLTKTSDSRALVFFTPHRPWLFEKDMAFLALAKEAGFLVEKVLEEKMEKVMFETDRGDHELRRTVFGFEIRWAI